MSEILFIDANKYLELYRAISGSGKKLIKFLVDQRAYILVSDQIVDEVLRNKLGIAQASLAKFLKDVEAINTSVPDHLLGLPRQRIRELRATLEKAKEARKQLGQLATEALSKISRSEDEVSKELNRLFDQSVSPNSEELARARARKEVGNPPGKATDPLGDQISWEQLLSACRIRDCERVWIISSDQDYLTKNEGRCVLNPFLTGDLFALRGDAIEIYCFDSLAEGIKHFGENVGVKPENLPSEKEATQFQQEIESLPPIGWLAANTDIGIGSLYNRILRQSAAATSANSVILVLPGDPNQKKPES
jgi:hypothetical protein